MENGASPDDRTSGIADVRPALRAPRPQSWAPPLPPHRVPIPPPPLANQPLQARAPLPVPSSPRGEGLLVAPRPSPASFAPSALPSVRSAPIPHSVLPMVRPPARLPAALSVAPPQDDFDTLGADLAPQRQRSRLGSPSIVLVGAAAIAVGTLAVIQLRPDVADSILEFVRGPSAQSPSSLLANSTAVLSPVGTAAAAPRGVSAAAGSKAAVSPNGEPPVISVWSLPVAYAGQAPAPPAAAPVFRAVAAAPHARQSQGFVPNTAFAFNFNAAPPPPTIPVLNPASNVAPAPPPEPVEAPAPRPAPAAKAVQPAIEAPPPAAAPPPPPVAAPPPPPKKFAPGSLEDQIQKAVEAEQQKKK
jgi:hypothetical protein